MSEHNGSPRSFSWFSFLFGFGFWLAWSTGRTVLSVQRVNLTQMLDGNLSHSGLPVLYCLTVVVGEVDELEEDVG